ncbi:hypothetical protein V1264_006974 [Littorina saxatilis]|uniref:Uncharacterized protein n=1 Tax=Littorina saxatilis TaxID=31220 RepID=A0AAN9ATW4_9CAEN
MPSLPLPIARELPPLLSLSSTGGVKVVPSLVSAVTSVVVCFSPASSGVVWPSLPGEETKTLSSSARAVLTSGGVSASVGLLELRRPIRKEDTKLWKINHNP